MYRIFKIDPGLIPYESDIELRMQRYETKKKELLKTTSNLADFANGAEYFGIHKVLGGWVYREWAPAAEALYLMGDFNQWDHHSHPMKRLDNGVFELQLKGEDALWSGCKIKTVVVHDKKETEHIPLYATHVVQDKKTYQWCAEIYESDTPFEWTDKNFKASGIPYVYECHIGMAQEEEKVGSYMEFAEKILPRIVRLGYNTIQIMAIMEHPYYGSFGYQVSNFFAASSRYGTPDELKYLVNRAHKLGLRVLLDVVHSHAVRNTSEGINEFDGTTYQFFHDGGKGDHSAWGTKLFNYGKNEVLHFLLSNLKYWMTEYHFDGFRFDGVTSMLYLNHGLGIAFDNYGKYFSMNTDIEAINYLQLANELIHQINPNAMTVAEDMSGMPGMCLPISDGGIGFDYRLSMGVPDLWIRLLKETPDEYWNMDQIFYELSGRRPKEKNIGYAESHDQALVGDKTIMFRLCDKEMYTSMNKDSQNMVIDRGMALHKMIRLVTQSLAGEGYLNFMGNEFGHPEWIDFPREGNNFSHKYCRRQWSLVDSPFLRYEDLNAFDQAMNHVTRANRVLASPHIKYLLTHNDNKILAYSRANVVFAFNFHPTQSYEGYFIPVPQAGEYEIVLSTDDVEFGGQGRISTQVHAFTKEQNGVTGLQLYLPSRTAVMLRKVRGKRVKSSSAELEKESSTKTRKKSTKKA